MPTRAPSYVLYGSKRPPPTPSQAVPGTGTAAGGTLFGIIGGGLRGSSGATFAGNPATEVTVIGSGTMVQGRTPPAPLLEPGNVEVVLIHPGGNVVVPGGWTYTAATEETEPEPELEEGGA
jgi:hypothetical protein